VQEQRWRKTLVTRALAPEHLVHRLLHREVEHADFAVAGQGMRRDLRRVVVEGFAEHEEAGMLRADASGECIPERRRHPADGVDAEGVRPLVDPVAVGIDHVVEHRGVPRIEIRELRQVAVEDRSLRGVDRAGGVVEAMQRVVRGIQRLRRQVLVVGDEPAGLVEHLAELRLWLRHRPARRAVVADDVQDQCHVLGMHRTGKSGEVQVGARQVFVER
jgi:hypothetical protein